MANRTIAYLDTSGSVSPKMLEEGLRKIGGSCELRTFDNRVYDTRKTVGEVLAMGIGNAKLMGGGGTMLKPVIEDFQASGAYSAYVISDGFFYEGHGREFYKLIPQGLLMKWVEVK